MKRFSIGNINISVVNLKTTLNFLIETIGNKSFGYLCVTNARTSYLANQDVKYCSIQNNSLLTLPDGIPLVWIANDLGFKEVKKVSGKELMDAIFKISVEKSYSHYFYGCSQNTIDLLQNHLKEHYPGLEIRGAVSPPFQPLIAYDIVALAKEVNSLQPTFFWCGLGAPKQEYLIALLQPHLKQTISVGVGLAFEYYANTIKRAPKFVENIGLEGFFRLSQQPTKARRFIKPFFWILFHILKVKLKIYK